MWFAVALYGLILLMVYWKEAYSEPVKHYGELFAKIVDKWKLLTIFKENCMLGVW